MSVLLKLSRPALLTLAAAIETGRLSAPYARSAIDRYVPKGLRQAIMVELDRLSAMGATPAHLAYTLNLLAAERQSTQQVRDRVELVWTGQEVVGSESRDTAVVVRELFSTAQH
ncbi:MAG: phospholipase, partial [Microcoleus sp. SIO2G3]|nr:phospholipase [Microcoleus sp. SIO2G3]